MLGVHCGWDGIDVDCGASLVSPACWCAKLVQFGTPASGAVVNTVRIQMAKILDLATYLWEMNGCLFV